MKDNLMLPTAVGKDTIMGPAAPVRICAPRQAQYWASLFEASMKLAVARKRMRPLNRVKVVATSTSPLQEASTYSILFYLIPFRMISFGTNVLRLHRFRGIK